MRGLVILSPGVALASGLASVPEGPCRHPHRGSDGSAVGVPGLPCACQVVTAAAWEAQSSWTAAQSAKALVAAAGAQPVELQLERGRVVQDPAREELAHAVRLSPLAMANHLAHARSLVAHPALLRLLESGGISVRAARLVLDGTRALSEEQAAELVGEVCVRI